MGLKLNPIPGGTTSMKLPTETTPLIPKPKPLSSQLKTFANIFISVVGSGMLGLPYTFKKTGWLTGSLMLLTVAALTFHCMLLLIRTRRKLESIHGFSMISSFGDVGAAVCGPAGRLSVDCMIVLSQAGFCVAYLIYIGNTLSNLTLPNPSSIYGISGKSLYIWGCLPFQIGLNSIPTLTNLAPLSIMADVVDIGAIASVMAEDVVEYVRKKVEVKAFSGISVFLYGIGVAMYAFEGIGMVLPLEKEAKEKERYEKTLGVCMGVIGWMYVGFGVLGYWAFGEETEEIISMNMGEGVVSLVVQIGICLNLFFTFPLMMNPVHEVFERVGWGGGGGGGYCVWVRWVGVVVVTVVAIWVPGFADFLALVGSSVCCVLGYVLPALFHALVFREEVGWWGVGGDLVVVCVGLGMAFGGTFNSVSGIMKGGGGELKS